MGIKSILHAKLKSNHGFTLVEMMVVAAILSVIMLAFTGYMFQQAKQGKVAESKQSFINLKANVLNASSQPESLSSSETMQFSQMP
ncbi:MAG: type II secretion system protein [Bdellovibrionales bacterium]|nr:type II secretion system protein [Oligoflexia bacterium]